MSLRARLALGAAFVSAAAVRAVAVASPDALARLGDDSFVCLDVARRLGTTGHLVTSGVQPLYVLLLAPVYALLRPETVVQLDAAARASVAVCALADLAAMALLAWLLWRAGGVVAATVGAWVWALHPGAIAFATNGLETSLALAAMLAVVAVAELRRDGVDPRTRGFAVGAAVGVAMIARIDLAGIGAAAALCALWDSRATKRIPFGVLLRLAAGWAAVYLPWVAFLAWQTGDVLPVSGPASMLIGFGAQVDWNLAHRTVTGYTAWLAALGVASLAFGAPILGALAAVAAPFARLRVVRLVAIHCVLVFGFYVGVQQDPTALGRYLAPWLVLEAMAIGLGAAALARVPWRRAALLAPVAAAAAVALLFVPIRGPDERKPEPGGALTWTRDYRSAALEWRDRVPASEPIGAPESGALAYYLSNEVVNADGACNRDAFDALEHYRVGEYLAGRGVRYVIGRESEALGLMTRSRMAYVRPVEAGRQFGLFQITDVEIASR
jgi:hypothetical protein